jgi:hypothetical protein
MYLSILPFRRRIEPRVGKRIFNTLKSDELVHSGGEFPRKEKENDEETFKEEQTPLGSRRRWRLRRFAGIKTLR